MRDDGHHLIDDLEDLFENAPCGLITLDAQGRIYRINNRLSNWLARDRDDLVGKRFQNLLSLAGQMVYETNVAPLLRVQGSFNEIAFDLLTANGVKIPVIANAIEHRNNEGLPLFTRICILPAPQRRTYERQLVVARTKSRAAEYDARSLLKDERETAELREQFIAVLGHDLRNPLASIAAGARILSRSNSDGRQMTVLQMMETTVMRMSGLIDNIMDFARGRLGGGITLSRDSDHPLEPTLVHVVDELRAAWPLRDIRTHFAVRDPVDCDRVRIGQLVSNLLGNALTHGAADQPVQIGASTDKGVFRLWVTNAGDRIAQPAMERLFEPFVRGKARDNKEGLGLGLHIASQIAKAHEGTLAATSTEEETRFTFEMPLRGPVI